jgi:anti-anti-sigma factor
MNKQGILILSGRVRNSMAEKSWHLEGEAASVQGVKLPAQLRVAEAAEAEIRILKLGGSADILSLPLLQDLFAKYTKEGVRTLFIDLTETSFINSPVWAIITLFARRQKSEVAIIGMSERIKGSFEMMGLQKELKTFATQEEARADLAARHKAAE